MVKGAGVFALALVVFMPSGARLRGPAGVMKALGSRLAFCVVFLVVLKLDWKLSFSSFWLRRKGVLGALLAGVFACWFNGFAAAAAW